MRRFSLVLLHGAMIVVAVGALITAFSAQRGRMTLHYDVPANEFVDEDRRPHYLPFAVTLRGFGIEHYADTDLPSDYVATVRIGDSLYTIRMNQPLEVQGVRLYQSDYDAYGVTLLVNTDAYGRAVVYAGYVMAMPALLCVLLLTGFEHKRLGLCLLLLMVCVACAVHYSWSGERLVPVLNSRWLLWHVSTIMTAYVLFAVLMLRDSRGVLVAAESLLAAGIMLGSVWADESWGSYWTWDPKETCALVTMLVYALPLHPRLVPAMRRPRVRRWYLVCAIAAVVVTYYGVNHFAGGLHSYA